MGELYWIALSYHLPSDSSKSRVYLWRKLRELGAENLRPGIAVLPRTPENLRRMRQLLLNRFLGTPPHGTRGSFSIYPIYFQDSISFDSFLSIFSIRFLLSGQYGPPFWHASHSSSISYTAFPSMTSLVFILLRSCHRFGFRLLISRSNGILSYTLYYADCLRHDMSCPRIYCFKKNKDPVHE